MVQASRRKYHYIYKTTCIITNRFYIGMHSTDDLGDGYKGSGKVLWYSIRKHGIENHFTEILEYLPSRNELKLRESQMVNEELLGDALCMNLKPGGEGGWSRDIGLRGNATQAKLRENTEWVNHKSNAVSKAIRNNTNAIEASRKRLQDRHAAGLCDYATYGMLGKEHSAESKQLMSEKQSGENNSQFGSCWIYSEKEKRSIKIAKIDLNFWVSLGWKPGRKIKFTVQ